MKSLFLLLASVLGLTVCRAQDLDNCLIPNGQPAIPLQPRGLLAPKVSFIDDQVVVLEYPSVYDVHVRPDTVRYPNIRIQPGGFQNNQLLEDLSAVVRTAEYDFVLLYTLHEVPGWINSGGRYHFPAKNIGLTNAYYDQRTAPNGWTRLRGIPHMNDVAFIDRPGGALPNYSSTLTAIHEIGHFWNTYILFNPAVGPREWDPTRHPLGYLAGCCAHWSWNWKATPEGIWPGIMASGATDPKFNAFDLYVMGLMNYDEVEKHVYTIYENNKPEATHEIRVKDLIQALVLAGPKYFEGEGKRFPSLDPSIKDIRALTVIVKGADETMTAADMALIKKLVAELPKDWEIATWGRSKLETKLFLKTTPAVDIALAGAIHLAPNPISDQLLLFIAPDAFERSTPARLTICNALGQLVFSSEIGTGSIAIPANAWEKGLYLVRIENGSHFWIGKVVKGVTKGN